MIKEIPLGGLTAIPDDTLSPDGDLHLAINLIPTHSGLAPIPAPKILFIPPNGSEVRLLHRPPSDPGRTFYITYGEERVGAYAADAPDRYIPLAEARELRDIRIHGNILVILTEEGIHYAIYRPDLRTYVPLGNRIPFPRIEFALTAQSQETTVEEHSLHITEDDIPTLKNWISSADKTGNSPVHPIARPSDSLAVALTDAILGAVNTHCADAMADGSLTEPFLIRYAVRLFDGSHVMQSSPVLLIPNSAPPVVTLESPEINEKELSFKWRSRVIHPKADICFRILETPDFKDWKDIITSIDIFITSPFWTYDQSAQITGPDPRHRLSHNSHIPFSHIFRDTRTNRAPSSTDNNYHRHPYGEETDDDLNSSVLPGTSDNRSANIDLATGNILPDQTGYAERQLSVKGLTWEIPTKKEATVIREICTNGNFYHIATIDAEEITPMDGYRPLALDIQDLSVIPTLQPLTDEWQGHATLIPKTAYVYNSRLNIADITLRLAGPLPWRTMIPMSTKGGTTTPPYTVRTWLLTRKNGSNRLVPATYSTGKADHAELIDFPRFLYVTDPDATLLAIQFERTDPDNREVFHYTLNLARHTTLNGAYWFRGLGDRLPRRYEGPFDYGRYPNDTAQATVPLEKTPSPSHRDEAEADIPTVTYHNKIYTSAVENPFHFPLNGINTIGTDPILALASATKALSQGQFGQYPLYAFTDTGIWALQVAADGTFSSIVPVSRDTVISPSSITQTDQTVLFATERGIIELSGSQTTCISRPLDTQYHLDVRHLPHIREASADIFPEISVVHHFRHLPFRQFLKKAQILYDYTNSHIILFNTNHHTSFILDIATGKWGQISQTFRSPVNGWPRCLATDILGRLVTFRAIAESAVPTGAVEGTTVEIDRRPVALLTRPFRIDHPDRFKTINTLIVRGRIPIPDTDPARNRLSSRSVSTTTPLSYRDEAEADISSVSHRVEGHARNQEPLHLVLYGTRDYDNWELIATSRTPILTGLRGTPWKAYRLLLTGYLLPHQNIHRLTVEYTDKLQNRTR